MAANLDALLLEARGALEALPEHLLSELSTLLRARFLTGAGATDGACPSDEPAAAAIPGTPLLGTRRPTAAPPPLGKQRQFGRGQDGMGSRRRHHDL